MPRTAYNLGFRSAPDPGTDGSQMPQLSQLLLFDPDPSGLDTLTYGFEKDGCSVTGTADPAKARDLIQTANPALVVINLRDSEQIGLDLLRSTTSNARTRNLPCVAIGREASRAAALGAGAFVFLSAPLFVRDVIGACRLVAAASVPGSRPSPDAELSLKLREVDGVYFLVRALAVTGRSAVIEVRRDAKRGDLRFIDGTLTSVQLGPIQGLPALHQMLLWDDADLHFKFKNVVRRGTPLSMKSGEVIEECDRFLRDFAHEAKDLGIARTIYSAPPEPVSSSDIPSEVIPVLKLFDGRRDLGHVLGESPFRVFDTLKIIKRFVEGEAIKSQTPLPAHSPGVDASISGPGALDFWLQRPAPMLGPEIGKPLDPAAQRASIVAGTDGSSGARPSSPFIAVTGIRGVDASAVPGRRKRTLTKREHIVEPTAPVVAPEDVPTPPPQLQVAVDSARNPVGAVARGEIKVASSPVPRGPAEDHAPSVLIEMGALPIPMPLSPPLPAPITALVAPPSVVVASMTPAPAVTDQGSNQTPSPTGSDPKRAARSPSDNFNAVEADFFDREADLYKRESVESFEDLDRTARPANRPSGTGRKP
jgi:ActR/RegA family two-component response regulator